MNGAHAHVGHPLGGRKPTFQQQKELDIEKHQDSIYYSPRYYGEKGAWPAHVTLPKALAKYLPNPLRLLDEDEWRGLGVRQSPGWYHYMVHAPEPHILLFKREKDFQLKYPNGQPA
ncbi:regulatory subunit of cyclin-dependent kinase [Thamnocephalis sphaerospora]|uniref:Cyclin-dependent kinases regulatory subunit n=1 Tax=Thamnocephalis sphaerospora TaxID=78915 RepID=A0A4V1IX70_9FUNG|nr:regulatory subunit of cyclin-dependent kinase [Thamnocephalis sphaerospora]|eukprot:RKP10029.1 regulatory subunit of cyclin-dependent kinase [Thamnocephalis sphaerospora]